MSAVQFYLPYPAAFTSNGLPAPGATATFYLAGGTTPATVYADADLTTPHTNPVVADGGGRFPQIYLDNTDTYRVDIKDKNGALLTSVDPYIPGTVVGAVIGTGGAVVVDRTELASVTGVENTPVSILEAGRQGTFLWNPADLSAQVAADVYQGIYVAPATNITGTAGAWVRQYDGPIQLSWFGVVADGSTVNPAAVVNTAIAAMGVRGGTIVYPWGTGACLFDGDIVTALGPVRHCGYGAGQAAGANAATVLKFPAGKNGLVFLGGSPGAQRSTVEHLTIDHAAVLSTSATANYTAGSTTVTITGGTNDYAAGQIIRLRGAGPNFTPTGKSAAMTAGSNVATITSVAGNPGVYVGQSIKIPGAGAAGADLIGFVGSWGSTTINIVDAAGANLNASTPVSGAAYTITYPLVCRLASVSGSTLTLDQAPTNTQSVTGARLDHAETSIYASCTIDTFHVNTLHAKIDLFLHGETTGGNLPDLGSFYSSNFNGSYWAGVICYGPDAQVNNFNGCNFANPPLSFLDMSLIGNALFNCHFAFNVGYVGVFASQIMASLVSCYFEDGTSFMGASSVVHKGFGGIGVTNGCGIGFANITDPVNGNFPAIVCPTIDTGRGSFSGGVHVSGTQNSFRITTTGVSPPTLSTGPGIEGFLSGGRGWFQFYNRSTNAYVGATFDALDYQLNVAGVSVGTLVSAGINLASGKVLQVNGTQVVAARQTGTPAAATDAATTMALVNDIRTKLIAHGLIS